MIYVSKIWENAAMCNRALTDHPSCNIYNVPLGAGASSGGPKGRSCEFLIKLATLTNVINPAGGKKKTGRDTTSQYIIILLGSIFCHCLFLAGCNH